MIEASIKAVPGLLVSFLLLAALFALPVWLRARKLGRPTALPTVFAVSLAGAAAVTLLPGSAGTSGEGVCDNGFSATYLLNSSSALLNVALLIPSAFLAVLLFRRPVTVAASIPLFSACIEFAQIYLVPGRSCSLTDLIANSVGGLAGATAAILFLALSRRGLHGSWKDLAYGSCAAAAGAALAIGMFHSSAVATYDDITAQRQREARLQASQGSAEWIEKAAAATFGTGTQITQIQEEWRGDRALIAAETDRGEISGWWPDKKLKDARSYDNEGEPGDLSREQARKVGADFARTWFPQDVRGSRETVDTIAEEMGNRALYVLTYRRYTNDVMMPMRLDITVTSAGRVMGFSARSVPDPALPKVEVSREEADGIVRRDSGKTPEAAVLLAQRIDDAWRPVWMLGMPDGHKEPDVFIDAVTGDFVTPQPPEEGW
ncbi:VanZ family protein [Streptomyces sp. URMC 125]|uniref:VanZ family protein n=1 Tax=Streptomyces sp. URMC 125 TaxID=3423419 RepID=UPI003F1A83D8